MTARPIIFSAPMVQVLLAGRKTMTRRLLKPQPELFPVDAAGHLCEVAAEHVEGDDCPRVRTGRVITTQKIRFAVGDRLWVKETWARISVAPIVSTIDNPWVVYRAADNRTDYGGPWKSPLHLARRDSRLTLEVTAVRLERLHDITEEDAKAEGFGAHEKPGTWTPHKASFAEFWCKLHRQSTWWAANPFVVVVAFKVHARNIDAMPRAEAKAA